MAEFSGTDTVHFTGEYELDVAKLPFQKRMELRRAINQSFSDNDIIDKIKIIVTIPIEDLEFETEVTIEVEPSDMDWRD